MGVYDFFDSLVGGYLPGGVPTAAQQQQVTAPGLLAAQPAAAAGPRGRTMTMRVRVLPGQAPQPISIVPGGVALYSRDLTAAKRTKRVQRDLNRIFPRTRRGKGKK